MYKESKNSFIYGLVNKYTLIYTKWVYKNTITFILVVFCFKKYSINIFNNFDILI